MAFSEPAPGWWRQFVLERPARTAKLAVVRADGSPLVVPVWVDLDDDQVVFMTGADTGKGRSIRRDGRVSLCWDDERPPFSFVTVSGTATTTDDLDEMLHWGRRIAARYVGEDRAEAYARRNAVPGELLVRITPSRVVAMADVAN